MTRVIISSAKMQAICNDIRRSRKGTIGFVPTMGFLHEGHLSLMRKARNENDKVVVSIFVNPTQFGPKEDFKKYPRNFARDKQLCKKENIDFIFCPKEEDIYQRHHSTTVSVDGLTECLCGKSRPGHFCGVTTIVAKLFNIVSPDTAYFGQKDFQQTVVIKQMVKDLNFSTKIKVLPTIREKDGLAMSSRNSYLLSEERKDALVLYETLQMLKRKIKKGITNTKFLKKIAYKNIESKKTAKVDYIEIVDLCNLKSLKKIATKALIALAVKIGRVRLIDNIIVSAR